MKSPRNSPARPILHTRSGAGFIRLLLASLAIPTSALCASQVLVVDPFGAAGSDFTSLQAAIDAASDGDLLLLRGGPHLTGARISGKSLSLVGEDGAAVELRGLTIEQLAADERVAVRGCSITLGIGSFGLFSECIVIRDNAGSIWIEDCVAGTTSIPHGHPDSVLPAVRIENSTRVMFRAVDAHGTEFSGGFYTSDGSPSAILRNSTLFAFGCRFEGGAGSSTTGGAALVGNGGDGVAIDGGSAFFSGCQLVGGKGGDGVALAGPLVCRAGEDGGDGLDAKNHAIVRFLDTGVFAGSGGAPSPSGGCAGGVDGLATKLALGAALITIGGVAAEFSISSPERESTTHELHAHGEAGASIVLLVAATPTVAPAYSAGGALLVSPPLLPLPFGALPQTGVLDLVIPAGALPPAVDGITVYVQPIFFGASGAMLAPGTAVTLLDSFL